jgi:hypothetical protein
MRKKQRAAGLRIFLLFLIWLEIRRLMNSRLIEPTLISLCPIARTFQSWNRFRPHKERRLDAKPGYLLVT